MRMISSVAATAAVMLPLALSAAGATMPAITDPALAGRLDAVVDAALADGRIAGTVVLVARDGRLVYHRAAGHLDREAGIPMPEDAIFRFASVSKPFVAAAVLALADAGTVALDAPVTRYLPGFRPRLADGTAPVITLRHLLSHTSGLSYGFFEPADGPYHRAGVSDGMDQSGLSLADNLDRLASVPLVFAPGTGWRYSLGIDVAGAAIAAATGEPLPDLVRRLVTAPLGATDTGFSVTDASRLAVPYVDGVPVPRRMAEREDLAFAASAITFAPGRALNPDAWPSSGAGMAGTAADVLALLEAIRQGGAPVLTSAGAEAFTSPATGDLPIDVTGPGWRFGLGASVLTDPALAGSPQSAGSWSWGGVYGHSWFVDPVRKLTVVAMTNTTLAGMTGAWPDALRDAVYATGD